jgi:integrative and conjugative element protein (TIGR02256 family)
MWRVAAIEAWIASALISRMREEAESLSPLETGGILMGYWVGRGTAVITALVDAGPLACHREATFEPDYDYQEQRVTEIYLGSGGTVTYLGDWHSHPGGTTWLSRKDRRLLAGMARDEESRTPQPLMGVLGEQSSWELRLWVRQRVGPFGATRSCDLHEFSANEDK